MDEIINPGDTDSELERPADAVSAIQPPVIADFQDPEEATSQLPFPIVGIGASAGGLEAFTELLTATPADTGMSFVIISHLPAQHRSLLPEILSRNTRMPVLQIAEGMKPEPDKVFVIPANAILYLANGVFRLEPRPRPNPIPRPIDAFFRSLADEQKNRAIGIVLSGTDADGALGLKAIKGEGGIAIVQDERTARFESMPRNAIAADNVDLVLSPGEIGTELGRMAYELRLLGEKQLEAPDAKPGSEDAMALMRIYALLKSISGIDFNRYKQTTLRRRIARRMVVKKIDTLSEYARLLHIQTPEVRELYEDALIGVTRFFRDPEVFEALKRDVFPLLLRHRSQDTPIRIWVPGCASGEEVYSIAICLLEYFGNLPLQTQVQIFGTDVSERSIDKARLATYPDTIATEMSPERIRRFFTKMERGYQVGKRIRELCIFAKHNLMQDPPYSRLDLVSCRNVLIYLGAPAQKNVITAFHYALRHPGVLLLGQSETIREFSNLFTLRDKKNKIYTCNPGVSRLHFDLISHAPYVDVSGPTRHAKQIATDGITDIDLQRATDRIVVARHGPPGVVVAENMEIAQTRGDTSAFLMLPPGVATLNVLRMAKEGLGPSLRDAIQRAINDDVPVVLSGARVQNGSATTEVTLEVLPIPNLPPDARRFLVLFVAQPGDNQNVPPPQPLPEATPDEKDREIAKLRQDVASTKLYLQSLIEERDAKNQELISANEEVQSSNEELQSINEELETAKEELQSSNEELQTVNEELSRKNDQLTQTTSDLTNLLNNITMPVLILGADLHIRQFTPLAERVLSIRTADIGRHIREIRMNLRLEDIEPLLLEVLESLATKEIEVEDRDGRWHLLRARPYRSLDNRIDGVVIVLIEIEQIRSAQRELIQARDFAQLVIESVQVPLAVLDKDLNVRVVNHAFLNTSGRQVEGTLNRPFPDLAREVWGMENLRQALMSLPEQAEIKKFTFEHNYGNDQTLLVHAQAIQPDGQPGTLIALEDITVRKQAQQLLRRENQRLAGQVQMTEEALQRTNSELEQLAAKLLIAQEEERRSVARDLHDDLAQRVALLEMNVELAERSGGDQQVRETLIEIRRQAADLLDGLRRVAHELHPRILDDLGIGVALQNLADDLARRNGMPITFSMHEVPEEIPPMVASTLYRIAQEALHNALKHAGQASAHMRLSGSQGNLELTIHDEGAGFDTAEARLRGGLGLISMQERAKLVGGTLSVESQPGEGTTIIAVIPISEAQPE